MKLSLSTADRKAGYDLRDITVSTSAGLARTIAESKPVKIAIKALRAELREAILRGDAKAQRRIRRYLRQLGHEGGLKR